MFAFLLGLSAVSGATLDERTLQKFARLLKNLRTEDSSCTLLHANPYDDAAGTFTQCCSGTKKCLEEAAGWSYRCRNCHDSCPDDKDWSGRSCSTVPSPSPRECSASWMHTANAAIKGHNEETLIDVSVDDCKEACLTRGWCKSFDYIKGENKCDLSDVQPPPLGSTPLKTDYDGWQYHLYDNYSLDCAYCASIHMTNFRTKGIPQQIEEDSGNQSVREVDNCQQSKDVTLDQQDTHASSQSVENSYTQESSWSDTFSASVGTSVGFEIEEDLVFVKATESVEVTSEVGGSSTTSGSDTTTNVHTTITSQGDSSGATIIVPAYTSKIVHVDWQRFRVTSDYTATAICKDEKGNEIERRTVDGTWRGAYLSQTRVYLEDKTAECLTAKECMCAGLVASPLRQGIECSNYLTMKGTYDGQFCYVRAQAPCPNKEQLDIMDTPVDPSLFRKSSDPCVDNDLSARFLQLEEALFARQMEARGEHF